MTIDHTAIGQRMKANYEDRFRIMLPRRTYTLIRLDGKAFHSYTKNLNRPFDHDLMIDLRYATMTLLKEAQGSLFAYLQSDEISVLLADFKRITTDSWFDGNLQKIVSVSSSIITAAFNSRRKSRNPKEMKLAYFDARAWIIPDPVEVENYFIWRQQDCTRNSIQMVARSIYSYKELLNKNSDELQEMIFKAGQNWNDYPTESKRGSVIRKREHDWFVDDNIPVFTQDRDYLKSLISQGNRED